MNPTDPISHIESSISDAIAALKKKWEGSPSKYLHSEKELDSVARIEIALSDYRVLLRKVHETRNGSVGHSVPYATRILLSAPETPVAALVRSYATSNTSWTPSQIWNQAAKLSVWQALPERVTVRWEPKTVGFRPICIIGDRRRAQGLMVRDMLLAAGVRPEWNYAVKGAGGEKKLLSDVVTHIQGGKKWWWTPDVVSAFPSIYPGHLRWLNMDRRLLRNCVYLPKCAEVTVGNGFDQAAVAAWLKSSYGEFADHASFEDMTDSVVRRGLVQGSVLSSLLASAFFARVWREAVSDPTVVMLNWHDDLSFGSETKAQLAKAKEQLTQGFASLPAGPIALHGVPILHVDSRKVCVLGYLIEPGRGHLLSPDGSRTIHIKPGPKRIGRRDQRLREKIIARGPEVSALDVLNSYHRGWYGSTPAWTKVPVYSSNVSWMACYDAVRDLM